MLKTTLFLLFIPLCASVCWGLDSDEVITEPTLTISLPEKATCMEMVGKTALIGDKTGLRFFNLLDGSVSTELEIDNVYAIHIYPGDTLAGVYSVLIRDYIPMSERKKGFQTRFVTQDYCVVNVLNHTILWRGSEKNIDPRGIQGYIPGISGIIYFNDESASLGVIDISTGNFNFKNDSYFNDESPRTAMNYHGYNTLIANPPPMLDTDTTLVLSYGTNYLKKIDVRTGKMYWKQEIISKKGMLQTSKYLRQNPRGFVLSDSTHLIIPLHDRVFKLNKETGEIVKASEKLKGSIRRIIINEDLLFIETVKKVFKSLMSFIGDQHFYHLTMEDYEITEIIDTATVENKLVEFNESYNEYYYDKQDKVIYLRRDKKVHRFRFNSIGAITESDMVELPLTRNSIYTYHPLNNKVYLTNHSERYDVSFGSNHEKPFTYKSHDKVNQFFTNRW